MHRFLVDPQGIERNAEGWPTAVTLPAEEAAHAARVLRLPVGEEVLVIDGTGMEYLVQLTEVGTSRVRGRVLAQQPGAGEPGVAVCLFQGLPKAGKLDLVVQKATELGAAAVAPVICQRSVTKVSKGREDEKQERWERIAREAAKQCQRAAWPRVGPVRPLLEAVAQTKVERLLVAWEEGGTPLVRLLPELAAHVMGRRQQRSGEAAGYDVGVVIGPEGGLAADEVQALVNRGAQVISLGPRILRTETAGMVVLAVLMNALGELGGNSGE